MTFIPRERKPQGVLFIVSIWAMRVASNSTSMKSSYFPGKTSLTRKWPTKRLKFPKRRSNSKRLRKKYLIHYLIIPWKERQNPLIYRMILLPRKMIVGKNHNYLPLCYNKQSYIYYIYYNYYKTTHHFRRLKTSTKCYYTSEWTNNQQSIH